MSLEDTMRQIQAESEQSDYKLAAAQLRKFLAGALCAHCGEQLGEELGTIVQNDDEETMHLKCLAENERDAKEREARDTISRAISEMDLD